MLWIEKYRPTTFEALINRESIASDLKLYTLDTIPHLILYGGTGYGKRSILISLINHLYGRVSEVFVRESDIDNKVSVKFKETREFIEIDPSEYGNNDRIVVQGMIKDIAQTRPILSLVGSKQTLKLIVINEAEKLTKDAQSALRRTVETYSPNFRIVLLCTDLSKIIEPLKSRCFCLRIPAIDCRPILQNIANNESFPVSEDEIEGISKASKGNLRKAICTLETLWHGKRNNTEKRIKLGNEYLLEWELTIEKIGEEIMRNRTTQTIIEIRKQIYSLLSSCISPDTIFRKLFCYLIEKVPINKRLEISKLGIKYSERMARGSKSIFHIEAFVVSVMYELNRENSGNL